MIGNQINPDSDLESKPETNPEVGIRPYHTSNKMLVAVLEFVRSWLIPTALLEPSSPSLQHFCTNPFDLYKSLVQKIRDKQCWLNANMRKNISIIRSFQAKITYTRRLIAENVVNPYTQILNVVPATLDLDRLNRTISTLKSNINLVKSEIKVITVEYNLLNQDISAVKLLKDLRACCYGIQNNMFV